MQQYILYGWDAKESEALPRRMRVRPIHLENAARLKATNNFIMGGAILNGEGQMIGSTMIMQFEDESGLQEWLRTEPYITGKVWEKYEVFPFRIAQVQ